jgi:serine/threonine protein phosphatase PrpC
VKGDVHHPAYGTTLIAAVITPDYWFGIHIGDGRFTVLKADGTFDQPVDWDDRCFLNATTSICDDDAVERARFYFAPRTEEAPPVALFLCSDGVDDNYPVEENEKHLYALYKIIAETFVDEGFDATKDQLSDLANSFATKGKGDDTSIAGIIDIEAVKAALSRKEDPEIAQYTDPIKVSPRPLEELMQEVSENHPILKIQSEKEKGA